MNYKFLDLISTKTLLKKKSYCWSEEFGVNFQLESNQMQKRCHLKCKLIMHKKLDCYVLVYGRLVVIWKKRRMTLKKARLAGEV